MRTVRVSVFIDVCMVVSCRPATTLGHRFPHTPGQEAVAHSPLAPQRCYKHVMNVGLTLHLHNLTIHLGYITLKQYAIKTTESKLKKIPLLICLDGL